MDIAQIRRPTLLVDLAKVRRNIRQMADKARQAGVLFRPHFKTPQSLHAGEWFRAEGVKAITVSSVAMAEYFQSGGWNDIVIAFPVNVRELPALNVLASKGRLGLILDSEDVARSLSAGLLHPVDVWIEVDCGQNRSGLHWTAVDAVRRLARVLRDLPHVRFQGLLTHAGHSYQARGAAEILNVHAESLGRIMPLKQALIADGHAQAKVSYGDTPTCSIAQQFMGVDELRPGNFVFYDLMQVQIGSCAEDQVAAALACPVVAVYPERGIAIIHGGAVHLSKDALQWPGMGTIYGQIALPAIGGWTAALPGCYLKSLSQEHGVVALSKEALAVIHPGDLVMVLPVHSCLTADLMGAWIDSEGILYEMMPKH